MAKVQRNFVKGIMNKSLDERLIPNGQYVDAQNVRLGSTENSEIGSVENTKGNVLIAKPAFPLEGNPCSAFLSDHAKCIGTFADSTNDVVYWFIHDPKWQGVFPPGGPGTNLVTSTTTLGPLLNQLVDNTQTFLTSVSVGDIVESAGSDTPYAYIVSIPDDITLILSNELYAASPAIPAGTAYTIKANHQRCDMIVSRNPADANGGINYHAVSIWDNTSCPTQWKTTLNFNPNRLITGVNKIENLLFFTDNYNPPRKINIERNLALPTVTNPVPPSVLCTVSGDNFTADEIMVIRKPPASAPTISFPTSASIEGPTKNYLENRFISFAYRYRYDDDEYSAISQFSEIAFQPKPFFIPTDTSTNEGMQNQFNRVTVSYNTGGPLVRGIDLLFKDADNNIVKIIEKIDKNNSNGTGSIPNNITESILFDNSKIYQVLPTSELIRLYDNVPRVAQAQTLMGNRLMYGNYVDGYNLFNKNNNRVVQEFTTNLINQQADSVVVPVTTSNYSYNTYSTSVPQANIPNAKLTMNFANLDLNVGNTIKIKFQPGWGNGEPWQIAGSANYFGAGPGVYTGPPSGSPWIAANFTFEYTLTSTYTNAAALLNDLSQAFQSWVGYGTAASGNIQTATNSLVDGACTGSTLTDFINCSTYATVLDGPDGSGNMYSLIRYLSGDNIPAVTIINDADVSVPGQSRAMQVETSGVDGISLILNPIIYVRDPATLNPGGVSPTPAGQHVFNRVAYAFNAWNNVEVTMETSGSSKSLHSNRNYEVGIIYMDEFNRATTALTSPTNVVATDCNMSDTQNIIQVQIPDTQLAPKWATTYKFCIKPDEENYETIYSTRVFVDPKDGTFYFMLDGENAQKVSVGQRLILKKDANGPITTCDTASVTAKESYGENFILPLNPNYTGAQPTDSEEDPAIGDNPQYLYVPAGAYMQMKNINFVAPSNQELQYPVRPSGNDTNEPYPITQSAQEAEGGECPFLTYRGLTLSPVGTPATYGNLEIPVGTSVRLTFRFDRRGGGQSSAGRRGYVYERTWVADDNYPNMIEMWNGMGIGATLDLGTNYGAACPNGVNMVYVSETYDLSGDTSSGAFPEETYPNDNCTAYFRWAQNPTNGNTRFIIKGPSANGDVTTPSVVTASFDISFANDYIVFETEPQEALPEIWYEGSQTYTINAATGGHNAGTINPLDQDQVTFEEGAPQPAIIYLDFFNCYQFGNGVESYKINDSVKGRTFNLGQRVTSTTEDYQEVRRFADITYSGVYNDESNVNKLNEFNLGLLNFKPLEESFGSIQILDGRETDVLVLQSDRISYVLQGKNLLSDSTGGGEVASVPEVLGTQIAREEEYGISNNPESYVVYGYDKYFMDQKRGAVLRLRGSAQSNETLNVISDLGMRNWFRDTFNGSNNSLINSTTQKLGGYDPYMNEYVMSMNSDSIILGLQDPCDIDNNSVETEDSDIPVAPCGEGITFNSTSTTQIVQAINLGEDMGPVNWTVVIPATSGTNFFVAVVWDNSFVYTQTELIVGSTTNISFDKLNNTDSTGSTLAYIYITPVSAAAGALTLNTACPEPVFLNQICVVFNSLLPSPLSNLDSTVTQTGGALAATTFNFADTATGITTAPSTLIWDFGTPAYHTNTNGEYPLLPNIYDLYSNNFLNIPQGTEAPPNGSTVTWTLQPASGSVTFNCCDENGLVTGVGGSTEDVFTINNFDVTQHKGLYVRRATALDLSTVADRKTLLSEAYDAANPNSGVLDNTTTLESWDATTQAFVSPAVSFASSYRGTFTMPTPTPPATDPYIYYIWDLRYHTQDKMCQTVAPALPPFIPYEVCCDCNCDPATTYTCYKIVNSSSTNAVFTYDYIDSGGAPAQASITSGTQGPTTIYICSSTYPLLNTSETNYAPGQLFPVITIEDCYNIAGGCVDCGT
jgi:hypothetical protein